MSNLPKAGPKFEHLTDEERVEVAERAKNLRRWADAVESDEYHHVTGSFSKGEMHSGGTPGRDDKGRFTKGAGDGGVKKMRCVWGVLADIRVQDGVGSWGYGGYNDDAAMSQNMPSAQLSDYVGLHGANIVSEIVAQQAEKVGVGSINPNTVPADMVNFNDSAHGHSKAHFTKLAQMLRSSSDEIERRLNER